MGRDKALLTYRGRSFLETIVNTLRQAHVAPILVVLGHHARRIERATNLEGVEVLLNPRFRLGQTSSLQRGLRALGGSGVEAILLCLVDHPAAAPATVRALISAFRESPCAGVLPVYRGRRGHPVVIGRALFPEILALSPTEGANTVTRRHGEGTREVEVDDPGIRIDVDDPGSYWRLKLK